MILPRFTSTLFSGIISRDGFGRAEPCFHMYFQCSYLISILRLPILFNFKPQDKNSSSHPKCLETRTLTFCLVI